MIRHIVLLRFKDSVTAETKAALYTELQALRGHLKGIEGSVFGSNISPEAPVIHGFMDGFWFDFIDEAARDAYLVDPAHQAAGAKLVANTVDGIAGLIVFDIKV
ncbi:MAG: Dabb [Rhizobium sp.]|nr:Dabb [Rhizobium sp.]